MDDVVEWVLWCGTIGFDSPVDLRIEVAAATGFAYVSLSGLDVRREAAAGSPPEELARRAADAGVGFVIDPIMNWHPVERPSRLPHAVVPTDEVLRMAEALGARSVSAIAASTSAASPDELAERFAGLCDAAAEAGTLVHLEFMPMTAIPDLATGWAVVGGADRPNGGLLFDTWHFFRSDPDLALLATIPGERILAVQVDDGPAEPWGTLWEETGNRLLPGEGAFDLDGALGTLADIGALRFVGPEVISPAMAALPPEDAARLAGDTVRAAVGAALARRR